MDTRGSCTSPGDRHWLGALAFAFAVFVFTRVRNQLDAYVGVHRWLHELGVPAELRNLDGPVLLVAACLLAARIAWGRGAVLAGLGLLGPCLPGIRFALVAGLPMLVQAALASEGLRLDRGTLRGVFVAPFVEELFFRAVLVAMAVRVGGMRFWPTAALAALVFGAMHVPWTSQFDGGHAGILAATTAGGLWYAWLLRIFAWNLWTTIVLHAVMNGAWTVFAVADSAAGGMWPNVGRGLTIALGTALALRHRRRCMRANVAAEPQRATRSGTATSV